jgi:lysophospholipase L1-like esterase
MRRIAAVWLAPLALVSFAAAQQTATTPTSPTSSSTPAASCPEVERAMTQLMQNDARLRDWPNLNRYREANRKLAAPASGESRIVFMGDSITDSWPQPQYGDLFTKKANVGRGISGQTTPQMLIRFRPDVIDLKPKAVVILAGTNDIAGNTGPMTNEEIQANLQSMAELAKAAGVKVILASILPVSNYHVGTAVPQTTRRPMDRIRAINEWLKKYADAERQTYLDYFSAMTDSSGLLREELSGDDLHPNAKGYAIMAPLAEAAVRKALQ